VLCRPPPVNKLQNVLGAAAVIAIAVVFILQFRPASNAQKTDTGPQCAVEVHGSCISANSFWAAYRLIAPNADPARLRAMGLRRRVADGLVEQWALNQDAKRLGITVSDEEITEELAAGRAHVSLPVADMAQLGQNLGFREDMTRPLQVKNPKTKKFDPKVYEKEVRQRTKMSPAEFRDFQRAEIVAARMRDLVRARVRVGEDEAYDQFSREKATATVSYARFDRRFYADVIVDDSPKAVDAWAALHKEDLDKVWEAKKTQILPECRSVREILVSIDEYASDEDKAKAKAKIERAKDRVQKGEDFGDVARAMSDDPSFSRGGDIGCMLRGLAQKPLAEAVAALAPGKVSDVIATENGYWILKLDQIARDADAEKLGREQLAREVYVGEEANRRALEASKNVLAAVKGGKSLADAIAEHLADLVKEKDARAADAGKKPDDKKKADDGKGKGGKGEADKKDDGDRAPLTIQTDPSRPIPDATLPFNINGDPISGVKQSSDLPKAAFALDKPGDTPSDVTATETGYVVIQLKEKTPASKDEWEKNKQFYLGAMRAAKANDALIVYTKRLTATIASDAKMTPQIVSEPKAGAPGEGEPPPGDDDSGE
jgi:peptidyl-prolyl cis-trans isomerase D